MSQALKLGVTYALAFSGNGALLVALGRDVVAWDVGARKKRFRVHPVSHPSHCSIHPGQASIVVKNTGGRIVLLDANDGALLRVLDDARDRDGSNILHSACGDYLVDGSWCGDLTVRRADGGEVVFHARFPHEQISHVSCTACGGYWATVHRPKKGASEQVRPLAWVSIWTWPFSTPVRRIRFAGEHIGGAALAPDGRHLCLFGWQTLSLMRLSDEQLVASVVTEGVRSVQWAPDGGEIACVRRDGVDFRSAPALDLLETIALDYACDIAYSPDGSLLAFGSWQAGRLVVRPVDKGCRS